MALLKEFRGKRPQVDPTAFVAENAVIIGDVTIGKNCSVWYGAVLRGDFGSIVIGEGSNIQDNVTVHCHPGGNLRIGNNVSVGHNAVIHCREVGDNTLVGMGAMLLDEVCIGRDCIVGAGALVTKNTVIPEGTMALGVPAKPVKTLDTAAREELEREKDYVSLSRAYLAGNADKDGTL